MKIDDAIKRLSALAQESRLNVFRLLVKAGPNGMAAGEIARKLDIPSNTLSAQLLLLSTAGLTKARREGRWIIYAANFEAMTELLIYLTEDCCGGNARSLRAARGARHELLHPRKENAMKRLHVHVAVDNLDASIGFYSTLFAAPRPFARTITPNGCSMIRRSISRSRTHGTAGAGVDHLGIQVESDGELREIAQRLKDAGEATRDQEDATCCYAQSNKSWVKIHPDSLGNLLHLWRSDHVWRGRSACCDHPKESATACCGR